MYKRRKLLYIINIAGLFISLELFLFGLLMKNSNLVLVATVVVIAVIVSDSIANFGNRIILLLYVVSYVTFMLSKPLINLIVDPESNNTYFRPLLVVYLAALSIYFGSQICGKRSESLEFDLRDKRNKSAIVCSVSRAIYYSTILFAWAVSLEKIILVRNFGYIGLYTVYNSTLPTFVHKLSVINETSFYIYLMTYPLKKSTYISFGVYGIGLFLKLLTGVRGDSMTGIMLLITYTVFRNKKTDDRLFSGKGTRFTLFISMVLLVSFMGVYSSIRLGEEGGGFLHGIGQFFTQQGGTISVLKNSIDLAGKLKAANNNYSFARIFNYNSVMRSIGNAIFGFGLDGSKLHSGILDNNLAYILDRTYFNSGGGFGTAYLAELFLDYSYFGVILYNFLLGFILIKAATVKVSNWIVGAYFLYVIRSLYFLPRDTAFCFVAPILSLTNLLLILGIKFVSDAIYRKRSRRFQ